MNKNEKYNYSPYEGKFYSAIDKNLLGCHLCPNYCILKENAVGICNARKNINHKMISLVYGFPEGISIDPVEKKPLFHFFPGINLLSFGTIGCNLKCKFCQNWELSTSKIENSGKDYISPAMLVDLTNNTPIPCSGIAFTYNEPTIFAEYAIDVADICKEKNLKTVCVTNGYISKEARSEFYEKMDATNVDLKGFSDSFFKMITQSKLKPVLENLIYIKYETKSWLEITNLIIPGENDNMKDIKQMVLWIVKNLGPDVPLHFSAFHPAYKMIHYPPTPKIILEQAKDIALDNGMRYVYIGNVFSTNGENTYCHKCNCLLLERNGYFVVKNYLVSGYCPKCKTFCNGFFKKQ